MPDTDRKLTYANIDLGAFKRKVKIETRLTEVTEKQRAPHES